jgi:hypothetical protein
MHPRRRHQEQAMDQPSAMDGLDESGFEEDALDAEGYEDDGFEELLVGIEANSADTLDANARVEQPLGEPSPGQSGEVNLDPLIARGNLGDGVVLLTNDRTNNTAHLDPLAVFQTSDDLRRRHTQRNRERRTAQDADLCR